MLFCLTGGEEEGEGAGLAALEEDSNFLQGDVIVPLEQNVQLLTFKPHYNVDVLLVCLHSFLKVH